MTEFFNGIGMIGIESTEQIITGIVRIVLAAVLGALIGMERGRKHRPAGIRTHMLVCLAAALVMITNEQLIFAYGSGDPTRMGAQVISGIGFLGAGTILTDRQNRVRGLTTAAGLWASACMGLAVGGGYYIGAIATCVFMLLIFTKFVEVESRLIRRGRLMEVNVSFDGAKNLNNFISEITGNNCSVVSFEYIDFNEDRDWHEKVEKEAVSHKKIISVSIQILLPKQNFHSDILRILEDSKGMIWMEEG